MERQWIQCSVRGRAPCGGPTVSLSSKCTGTKDIGRKSGKQGHNQGASVDGLDRILVG